MKRLWWLSLLWGAGAVFGAEPSQTLEQILETKIYPARYAGYYKDTKGVIHGCEVAVQNAKISKSQDGWQLSALSVLGGDGFSVRGNRANLMGAENEELKDYSAKDKKITVSVNYKTAKDSGIDQGVETWIIELTDPPFNYEPGHYGALKSVAAQIPGSDKEIVMNFLCEGLEIITGN